MVALALTAATLAVSPIADWSYEYTKLTSSPEVWYGSTFHTGPDWTRVGRNWHHSGENVASARVFTAPRSGQVRVTGRVFKLHTDGGDGVRAAIRSGTTLWTCVIEAADSRGFEHDLALDLEQGQRLCFVVGKRGTITCDTTGWDPLVTYADGAAYRASEGFDTGDPVWAYEMEKRLPPPAPVGCDPASGEDLLPGVPPEERSALQWRAADGAGGVVVAARDLGGEPRMAVALRGLVPGTVYAVTEDGGTGRACLDGAQLMSPGLTIALAPGQRRAFRYEPTRAGVDAAPPAAPAGLEARREGGSVTLSWSAAGLADAYIVLRHGDVVGRVTSTSFEAQDVPASEPCRFAVAAERGLRLSPEVPVGCVAEGDAAAPWEQRPELALWAMVEDDWLTADHLSGAVATWDAATARHLELAGRLIRELRALGQAGDLVAEEAELRRLAAEARSDAGAAEQGRSLYLRVRWLKRHIALSNPLLGFGELLFAKRVPSEYSHLVMQYFGWRALPGGGLFALEQPGRSLRVRPVLDPSFATGSVFAPNLSFDGRRVLFSWSSCVEPDTCYHVFEADLASGAVRQLTSGPYDDLMPTYLPNGDIVLCSTRRRGYARCFGAQFGERWHVYTLHRMGPDGSNLRALSVHETNEWFPEVLSDGSLTYARWDYVDRHAVLHQNLWRTNPDGTLPVALWGNHTEDPHCSFEARTVPGSRKILCTASAHHSITAGSLMLIDPERAVDGQEAVERVTPDVCFPEAEGWPSSYYATPWPLSEDFYLASYSPRPLIPEPTPNDPAALGLYLVDRWGNRELLYRDPAIGCTSPIPLRARPCPPVIPDLVAPSASPEPTGRYLMLDVNRGLAGVAPGSVKALRVVQILPKATPVADAPPVGLAGQEPARAVLGTIPVEADGSAYFEAPALKPLLFQALDERGMAIQTMRSAAYLQAGETLSCVGCHDARTTAPPSPMPVAARREPSAIRPGPDGTRPFSFARLVQPVLDRHCASCHPAGGGQTGVDLSGTPSGAFSASYMALTGGTTSFYYDATNPENARAALVPRYGGWNPVHSTAVGGTYGSHGSRLMRMLDEGHYGVTLPPDDWERLAIWIDANALFYGTYDVAEQQRQLAGEVIAMPELQ